MEEGRTDGGEEKDRKKGMKKRERDPGSSNHPALPGLQAP